jgi:GNAT superfamily N-acetyltransferase
MQCASIQPSVLDGEQTRGIATWLDGKMVGIAHYVFDASIWRVGGRCYLADLFVDPEVRRRGIATANDQVGLGTRSGEAR